MISRDVTNISRTGRILVEAVLDMKENIRIPFDGISGLFVHTEEAFRADRNRSRVS
jgi:hypothetical protein